VGSENNKSAAENLNNLTRCTPNLNDALMQNVSTANYGIVMALVFGWLVKRAETKTEPNPKLRKYHILPMPSYKKEHEIKKVRLRKPFKIK
jgi:hypothetical protein